MNFFKLVFVKQVGKLSVPNSSMMTICADTARLRQMSPQDAHNLDTLLRRVFSRIQQLPMGMNSPEPLIEAAVDRNGSFSVAMSGTKMVLSPVYGCPLVKTLTLHPASEKGLTVLGILYRHADAERHCMLKGHGVDPTQVDLDDPVSAMKVNLAWSQLSSYQLGSQMRMGLGVLALLFCVLQSVCATCKCL